MNEHEPGTAVDADARKAALEVLATLVNVKKIAADRLLRPAGVPDPLVARFLRGKDAWPTVLPRASPQNGPLRHPANADSINERKLNVVPPFCYPTR